jgi:sporadic carbohydrate cluster 2OG-Fe(II) oxygenase
MKSEKYDLFDGKVNNLKPIYKAINREILKVNKSYNYKLDELHNYISCNQINLLRTKCFQKINSIDWKNIIKSFAFDNLVSLIGPDLLIQSKINLSIQMPGDKTSVLPIHSDSWSSDTPFQFNLWIPLTNAYDTNSMFILDKKYSKNIFSKINENKKIKFKLPKKKDFVNLKTGQYIIFNPAYLHGNIRNLTKHTRVSLNVRFKSLFAPEPNKFHQDRKYGTYYQLFSISKNTKFALDLIKSGVLN